MCALVIMIFNFVCYHCVHNDDNNISNKYYIKMGSAPSSYKDTLLGKFFINKKITILTPTYITCHKNSSKFLIESVTEQNIDMDYYDFIIKLKPGVCLFIDDIVGWCYNEGGVFNYDFYVTFLHDLTIDDIFEFVKIPQISSDKEAIDNLQKIYNANDEIFNMNNMNKYVTISQNIFKEKGYWKWEDVLAKYDNIYEYLGENRDQFEIEEVDGTTLKNIIFFDRMENYEKGYFSWIYTCSSFFYLLLSDDRLDVLNAQSEQIKVDNQFNLNIQFVSNA